jgi:hypothetical protein
MKNYITELADAIRNKVDPDLLADEESDGLFRLYAVLALAKGAGVTAEDVHNAWAAWMSGRAPDHKAIRPYSALAPGVKQEDQPFLDAIRTVANEFSDQS